MFFHIFHNESGLGSGLLFCHQSDSSLPYLLIPSQYTVACNRFTAQSNTIPTSTTERGQLSFFLPCQDLIDAMRRLSDSLNAGRKKGRQSSLITIQLTDCCFSVCNVASLRLEIDGANRGCRTIRLESSLSQIDHLLKVSHDPIEFMCQAIGINPSCKSKLDEALAKQVVQNMPKSGFQLLNGSQLLNESAQPKGI